jgi:hypothetical protein
VDQRVRLEWRKPSIGEEALPGRGPRGFIRFPSLYREAWARARDKRPHHRALSDEFLWHDVYNFYVENSPLLALSAEAERSTIEVSQEGHDAARTVLVEALYGNVRPIAGEIATKRFPSALWPSQRTIPKAAKHAYDGQRDRIHELASVGIFGLIIAADRFSPKYGRFWTYAKYWVEKYMLLYAEEMVGVIPRTGDMGIEEEGKNDEGEDWVVYKPRRSVMDLIEVALAGERSYRGKASGGMAMFDAGLLLEGVVTNDCVKLPDFEFLSTEGPTREYLQRRVSNKLYPWIDNGTHAVPRLTLPGHAGGKASDKPPIDLGYEPDPVEEIELPDKPVTRKRARPLTLGQSPRMADGG